MIISFSSYGFAASCQLPCHCEEACKADVAISWYNKAIADAEYSMNSTRMVSFIGHLSSCYFLPGDCHVAWLSAMLLAMTVVIDTYLYPSFCSYKRSFICFVT